MKYLKMAFGLLIVMLGSGSSAAYAQAPNAYCGNTSIFYVLLQPLCETQNLAASLERPAAFLPFSAQALAALATYNTNRLAAIAADPERAPNINPCTTGLCAVDPRLLVWGTTTDTIVKPVLYTSRSGGTISGHVWATVSGPAKRPGVVIINGSIVGFEQNYWHGAQDLAKAGFVVLSFDAQGEGMSDQFGEAPDQLEDAFAGTPALGSTPGAPPAFGGNGLPFYDGGSDALNFLLSTPSAPYVPVASRTSGTSHAAKQLRRVTAGLNSNYNPLWAMLDGTKIGLMGHSYGAIAASWLAQQDSRVSAAVAWDNVCTPVSPSPDEVAAFLNDPVNNVGGIPTLYGLGSPCFGAPAGPTPAITKPVLGITGDYIVPFPYLSAPNPANKTLGSLAYSQAGVDNADIVLRGGTHTDFMDTPVIPGLLRGIDLSTWYTTAWFQKYLLLDPTADAKLISKRWQNDSSTGKVDPAGDPNIYSWHYRSRMDIKLSNGSRFTCGDLRSGCAGQVAASQDGGPTHYSFATNVGITPLPNE